MLAVIALIVLVIIGAVVYFIMQGPKGPAGLTEEGLKMAPATTQIFIASDLTALYDEAKGKELLMAFKDSKLFKNLAEEMKGESLDAEKDIFSWMKPQAVFALAPLDGKPSVFSDIESADGKTAPFKGFMLLGVRDDAAAKAGIEKMVAKGEKMKFKSEDYKGATIWTPEKGFEDGPTVGLKPGMFIMTLTNADMKMFLDGPPQNLGSSDAYKKAVAKVKHSEAAIGYVDLMGLIKGAPTSEITEPEVKKLVEGLRTLVIGTGKDGKDLVSEAVLTIDPATAGKLAPIFFKPSFGIDMKSAEYYPQDTELYGAVNLKMIWTMVYDAMGEFPQAAQMRDLPAMQLKQGGIDLQKQILDPLTGELGYSVEGYSKMLADQIESVSNGQEPDPGQSMNAMAQMPVVLTLGLANKATIEDLINKQIPEPARAQFQKEDYKGVTIYGIQGQFFYAMTDDFMLIGINKADGVMKKMIDAKKDGKNITKLPGYAKILSMLGSEKPVYLAYVDVAKIYGEAGNDIAKEDPGMGKFLQLLVADYQGSFQAGALRNDGIYMSTIMTGK